MTLHDSDVTIGTVNSERGNVSITNRSGSLLAGDGEYREVGDNVYLEENVHGRDISLAARDTIGSADRAFVVEETAHKSTQVVRSYMVSLYGEEGMTDTGLIVDVNGNTARTDDKPIGSLYLENEDGATLAERVANTSLESAIPTLNAGRVETGWPGTGEEQASVTMTGDNVYVDSTGGGFTVNEIVAEGDLSLEIGGDLADAGNTGLGDTLERVTEAQEILTEAERTLNEKALARDEATEEKRAADEAVALAEENKTQADAELAEANAALAEANEALNEAQQALTDAAANLDENDEESVKAVEAALLAAQEALEAANEAEALVEARQAAADAADTPLMKPSPGRGRRQPRRRRRLNRHRRRRTPRSRFATMPLRRCNTRRTCSTRSATRSRRTTRTRRRANRPRWRIRWARRNSSMKLTRTM